MSKGIEIEFLDEESLLEENRILQKKYILLEERFLKLNDNFNKLKELNSNLRESILCSKSCRIVECNKCNYICHTNEDYRYYCEYKDCYNCGEYYCYSCLDDEDIENLDYLCKECR